MVSDESHYAWGRRHRLKVVERPGRAHLETDGDRLLLYVPEGMPAEGRRELLDRWYRDQLRHALPDLIAKREQVLGVAVPKWTIRRKDQLGILQPGEPTHLVQRRAGQEAPECLEYIVVHEMTHYLERNHGERFTTLMDGFMSDWRARRDRLNAAPLATEEWTGARGQARSPPYPQPSLSRRLPWLHRGH